MNINYYTNNSGKNLILDYINSLSKEEQIDALSVIQCMEEESLSLYYLKNGTKKYMKFIFISIIVFFI